MRRPEGGGHRPRPWAGVQLLMMLIFCDRGPRIWQSRKRKGPMPAPDKLRDDPIVEALLEIRFAATAELEEVVVGRLSDIDLWRSLQKTRLPVASIPEPIRASTPGMAFVPTIEIRGVEGIGAVRIGGKVLGLHFVRPYDGWENIFPRIGKVIHALFLAVSTVVIERIALRYINVFTEARHGVRSVHDLNVKLLLDDRAIDGPMNVVFSEERAEYISQMRLASRRYLQGQLETDSTAAAEIQVNTPAKFSCSSAKDALVWIDRAHDGEKAAFRRLLPDDLYASLLRTPAQ